MAFLLANLHHVDGTPFGPMRKTDGAEILTIRNQRQHGRGDQNTRKQTPHSPAPPDARPVSGAAR